MITIFMWLLKDKKNKRDKKKLSQKIVKFTKNGYKN